MPTQPAQPFKPLNASEMHQTQRNYEENDPFSEVAPTQPKKPTPVKE